MFHHDCKISVSRDIANVLDFIYEGSIRLGPKDVEGFRTVADWAQISVLVTVRVVQINGLLNRLQNGILLQIPALNDVPALKCESTTEGNGSETAVETADSLHDEAGNMPDFGTYLASSSSQTSRVVNLSELTEAGTGVICFSWLF